MARRAGGARPAAGREAQGRLDATMTDETAPAPSPAKPDFQANFKQLPLVEKVLAVIAIVVIIGWIIAWSRKGDSVYTISGFFSNWFTPLSFLGALAIVTLVVLKVFGVRPLPPNVESKVIPIASLLPVLGYLTSIINMPAMLLTIGGSIALAYISATTYWRQRIPEFATKPLGPPAAGGSSPPPPSPSPPPA
jgi:hypothetical protein